MKLDYCLTPYTKGNMKWIKDLNVGHETIKLLYENIGKNLLNIYMSTFFSEHISLGKGNKSKMNKWDYIKLKSFYTAFVVPSLFDVDHPNWCVVISHSGFNLHIPDN